jgi:hypothetical protein
MFRSIVITAALVCSGMAVSAQVSAGAMTLTVKKPTNDTTKTTAVKNQPKPYKDVIPATASTRRGMLTVHKTDDKYFFEIPDSLLGIDMLTVTRLSKSSAGFRAGMMGYAGDEINENVIRFEKGPNHRIFIRTISYLDYTKDSSSPMYMAVKNSNVQPIAASFDIKAYTPNGKAAVIDVTDYLNGDNDLLFFDPRLKTGMKLGALASDKSYIDTVKTFPVNTEIKTVKTYSRSNTTNATLEINTSIILLPKNQMKPREYDNRIGYFSNGFYDYDKDPQAVKATYLVTRWRLEPKPEDVEKYKRGELVEPAKPIVIYIDPATPKKWVPYLIQGVNDWQVAFEKAGFKNAIYAREAPSYREDSTWSLEDARYSAIVYKPSPVANASGPHVSDPRTGEILETHINWYHNVMQVLQNWYFIQAAAIDPRARKMELDDELMGQLIRFVSSHEVGHTLGLRHNFGSSATVPVEKLRDKAWVEANGHTPSIMDYARFNYVAQPEDHIGEKGIYPRVGDYDKWAIEWGYKWLPEFSTAKEEIPYLNKWTIEKLKNPRLWFGREDNGLDPRSQNEDLGDNAMKANAYGIRNLKFIMKNLEAWTRTPNEGYANLAMMYNELLDQYKRYTMHVVKNIGGVYETLKTSEQPGNIMETVPAATQKEAMVFLAEYVFKTPSWMLGNDIMNKIGKRPTDVVTGIQAPLLKRLINGYLIERLIQDEAMMGSKAYKVSDLFADMKKGIWSELAAGQPVDVYRRNLQKLYVELFYQLLNLRTKTNVTSMDEALPQGLPYRNTDVYATIKAQMLQLQVQIKAAIPGAKDAVTKNHYEYMSGRISEMLLFKAENIY